MSSARSGRTTRMLQAALEAADAGHQVYVVVHSEEMKVHAERILEQLPGWGRIRKYLLSSVKLETPRSLGSSLDLQRVELRGAHPNCRLFVDHYLLETIYGRVIQEMHRWDEDP